MTGNIPTDPTAFFREMLGQWEKMANDHGTGMMKSSEFAQAMHGATAATMQAKEAGREFMTRVLAAYHLPSREEVAEVAGRLQAIEDRLAGIERMLERLAGAPARAERPQPRRTKTPPEKAR